MGAVRLVLGGAILGLFWGGFQRTIATSDNVNGLCDSSPCVCDQHGRLTCDCNNENQELTLSAEGERKLSPHTSRITVRNCSSVILTNSSLESMTGLRSVELINIVNLTLFTRSFVLSPKTSRAIISIHSANIDILPSFVFRGDMESISFENVHIGLISAFAFANLAGTDTLRLEECEIDSIEEQAFKKFDVNYLHIIGGIFGGNQVPSRAMNDIEVFTTFRMDGVKIGVIRSSGFVIKKPKTLSIQNCIIDTLESEAFDITTRGGVLIKNNRFNNVAAGSFLSIRRDSTSIGVSLPEITFTNNSLGVFEEGSIMFDRSSFKPIIDNIFINRSCDCAMLSLWKNNLLNYTNVYTRFYTGNTQLSINSLEAIEEGTYLCINYDNNIINFQDFDIHNCTMGNSTIIWLIIIVGIVLTIIIGIVMIIWCCRRRRNHVQKRWMSVPTTAPDVVSKKNGVIGRDGSSSSGPVDSRITMVVPDGRLYRETEFHVIVEKAEPLTTEL
ncbi:hypothetical protein PV327_003419 [Microctonus hyperodae]|uniref:Right handed beta helix domain-containing protein n=1 Tax=Microctonus hyperodae TaxID=165561 RepID=A0AA39G4A0_MICHY|nr:hypothetical protein PV327_003419 [Microctonus hyperodae]